MKGYAEALMAAGLATMPTWDEPLTVMTALGDEEDDYLRRTRHLYRDCGCTAMVCYSAIEAIRVIYACFLLGLRVPQDVSIVACDMTPAPECTPLPLTCFRLDRQEMAALAVGMLMERIGSGGEPVASILYEGQIVPGESVATIAAPPRSMAP